MKHCIRKRTFLRVMDHFFPVLDVDFRQNKTYKVRFEQIRIKFYKFHYA